MYCLQTPTKQGSSIQKASFSNMPYKQSCVEITNIIGHRTLKHLDWRWAFLSLIERVYLTESLTLIYVFIRNKLVMRIFSHQQLLLVVPHHKLHIHHAGTWVSTPCSQQLGPVCMTGTEYIMLIRTTKLALSTDIFLLTPSGTIINLVMLNCR